MILIGLILRNKTRHIKKDYRMKRIIIALIVITSLSLVGYAGFELYRFAQEMRNDKVTDSLVLLKDGDIIFQTSNSRQSKAIQLATNSKYSHMGIIYKEGDKLFVFEAVQPVKLTPLKDWIKRGVQGHYVVKRLKNADTILTPDVVKKMKVVGKQFVGKSYDLCFGWSDKRIYCSELVWKIYKEAAGVEVGTLQHLSDFDLSNEFVKKIMRERYGDNIPLNEIVISPASMFESDKLETVIER